MQETNPTLEKNLKALEKKAPLLVEKIREHVPQDIDFIEALTGDIVMTYKGLPLHSLQDPIAEAKGIFEHVKHTDFKSFNIIYGLGLGYLFKRATMETEGEIVIFEPHLDVLRATLEVVDFSKELENKRVWVVQELKFMRSLFMKRFYRGDYVGVQMLPTYRIAYPDILNDLTKILNELYRDAIVNQQTMLHKTQQWSLSALENIFDILTSPSCWELQNRFEKVPAVLVSAGPSLEYAIETLREVQDKVCIFAVGQSLKALDKAGIKPHLVNVIENLNISQQFNNISYLKDLTVVLQPMTHRSIYKLPVKGHMINFPKRDNIARWFGRIMDRGVEGYPNRGSVSFCCYYNAFHAGCEPMILVGQDLAFRDGKCYASNTSYDDIKYEIREDGKLDYSYNEETYENIGKTFEMTKEEFLNRAKISQRDTLKVKGWNGEDLYTNISYSVFLNSYHEIAELELEHYNKVLINSSVGGAYIKGLEHMPLNEALDRYDLDHGINIEGTINEIFNEFKVEDKDIERFVKGVHKTQILLDEAKELARESTEISEKILNELEKPSVNERYVDNLVIKMGKIDKKVIKVIKKTELINPFINKELYEYSSGYARSHSYEDPKEKIANLKSNIEQSAKLYQGIIRGSEEVGEILPRVLNENKELFENIGIKKA